MDRFHGVAKPQDEEFVMLVISTSYCINPIPHIRAFSGEFLKKDKGQKILRFNFLGKVVIFCKILIEITYDDEFYVVVGR